MNSSRGVGGCPVKGTGQRTFFHDCRANSEWDFEDIPFGQFSDYKIAQIGYILLLDRMDTEDPEYSTVMAKAFGHFQKMGLAMPFVPGSLYGLSREMTLEDSLYLGSTLAACNLFSPTATDGALSREEAKQKMKAYSLTKFL